MTIKVGIIGRGIIGQALAKKVVAAGWNLKFTADSKHVYKGYDIIGNIACLKNHIPNTD
ncbi:hypothetical protein ISS03_05200, partial [Patescibacteria group bacterium]|nr:hypothetical protein [Patescibacteria group bacterium]